MVERLVKSLKATLHADRGYINQELKSRLKAQGIDLIAYHRKNMQVVSLDKANSYHFRQNNKIEAVFSL